MMKCTAERGDPNIDASEHRGFGDLTTGMMSLSSLGHRNGATYRIDEFSQLVMTGLEK
jgi:hypothetical protein